MSLERAIQIAQQIVDALTDIRPYYRELTVINVTPMPNLPTTVELTFTGDRTERWTGLYAREILKHLSDDPVL